jgi:hypothetical protein
MDPTVKQAYDTWHRLFALYLSQGFSRNAAARRAEEVLDAQLRRRRTP